MQKIRISSPQHQTLSSKANSFFLVDISRSSRSTILNSHVLTDYIISSYPETLMQSKSFSLNIISIKGKGKGQAIPLQAWTGPECFRRLRLPDFKTIGT